MQAQKKFGSVDEYIKTFPRDIQTILEKIRQTIRKAALKAEETISYQMPTFKLNGTYLVYFGAWKNHIGFYATPAGNEAFKKELSVYEGAKGSVRFPIDQPMPFELIKKIVKFRIKESEEKLKKKNPFFVKVSAPAQRALEGAGITSAAKLAKYTENEILQLHGMGPGSMPKLRAALKLNRLSFKK